MTATEQLERKLLELQNELRERTTQMDELLSKSEKALDQALHAYKVDEYGFIWIYDAETKTYNITKMRVMTPEIADRAIHGGHLACGAITSDKIALCAITTDLIADDAVTLEKMNEEDFVTREDVLSIFDDVEGGEGGDEGSSCCDCPKVAYVDDITGIDY